MLLPWLVRFTWFSLPLTAGSVLADALDGRSTPVQLVVAVLAWATWVAVVLALLLPRPIGLTALRVAAVAAFAVAVWAAADSEGGYVLAALAGVPLVVALLPEVGGWFVNGAAYGDERRFLLRAPGALLMGPIPLSVVVLIAGLVTGPLLLAARAWATGIGAVLVGYPAAWVCAKALHQLTVRWAVLVPAGFVLKDHVTLLDPVFFKRPGIEVLRPAPADSDSLDLTARAPGLAVELVLREKEPVMLITPGKRENQPGNLGRCLFTPTRPGALLDAAKQRRIPVA